MDIRALRERNEYLEEYVRQLQDQLVDKDLVPVGWNLSPAEKSIATLLLTRDLVSRDTITTALYAGRDEPPTAEHTINVFIHRLRRKLAPLGIIVKTRHGQGWFIPETDRQTILAQIKNS